MRLTQITIENFGIYKGINTFQFPYNLDKKVSLLIGKNGAGKTTFLNAVKTCFFGSMILKNRTITKNYEDFIYEKLNLDALKSANSNFSVDITFVSHLHKFDGFFNIKRSWVLTNQRVIETTMVKKNDEILSSNEHDEFLNVMYHAYPLELFDLFYLDGEKIDELSVLNSNIIEMIESSINLDLFKTLKTDLATYAIKHSNSKQLKDLDRQKQNELAIVEASQLNLKELFEEQLILKNNLSLTRSHFNQFKTSLNLTDEPVNIEKLNKINMQIAETKKDLQELLISQLPYIFVKNQLKTVLTNIELEENNKKSHTIKQALTPELERYLVGKVGSNNDELIKNVITEIKEYYHEGEHDYIHQLSTEDYYNLKNKVAVLLPPQQQKLKNKLKKLKSLDAERESISKEREVHRQAEESGTLEVLLKLQDELSKNELKFQQNAEKIKMVSEIITKSKRDLEETEKEIWTQLKKTNVNLILEQLNHTLEKYITTIKKEKIHIIENQTKEMFDRLIRKQGFIKNFRLMEQVILLMDENGNQLNHSHLSAGERQLFILSLIYAIVQSSERKVPMIFDTLLSRLDVGHRNNVFSEFIASSTDQVIILATDSEMANIDQNMLDSITNVTYAIDFSKSVNQITEMRSAL